MIPVYQTIFDLKSGNCQSATIASLLHKDIKDVPIFVEHEDWFGKLCEYMESQGYVYHSYMVNGNRKDSDVKIDNYEWFKEELPDYGHFDGFYDATVTSVNHPNAGHAVICDKNFNIVHDPNPNNSHIKEYPEASKIGYNGIIGVALWIKDTKHG